MWHSFRTSAAILTTLFLTAGFAACGGETSGTASPGGTGGDGSGGSGGGGGGGGTGGGGGSTWAACGGPGECVAATKGCCGPCGAPTLDDVAGVNAESTAAFRADTCTDPNPLCPGCATRSEPNLVAWCEGGSCTAHDLRNEALSACSTDADCVLRAAGCCTSCLTQPDELVAIAASRQSEYQALACKPDEGCPKCGWAPPANLKATCADDGHCRVTERTNVCPEVEPDPATPCAVDDGLWCEYGDDPRPSCRTTATCTSGTWLKTHATCEPLPTAGEAGCPLAPTGDACTVGGLGCDLGNTLCECTACLDGSCSAPARWLCVAQAAEGCPPRAPQKGAACTGLGTVCSYGPGCGQFGVMRRCVDGAWESDMLLCPL